MNKKKLRRQINQKKATQKDVRKAKDEAMTEAVEDMARIIHEETGIDVSKSIEEIEAEVAE